MHAKARGTSSCTSPLSPSGNGLNPVALHPPTVLRSSGLLALLIPMRERARNCGANDNATRLRTRRGVANAFIAPSYPVSRIRDVVTLREERVREEGEESQGCVILAREKLALSVRTFTCRTHALRCLGCCYASESNGISRENTITRTQHPYN